MSQKSQDKIKEVMNKITQFKENEEVEQKLTINELNKFKPKTETQKLFKNTYLKQFHIICDGPAGTGKTFCALNLALEEVLSTDSEFETIYIVRSAVSTRDQGFLPGTEEEKMAGFEKPYELISDELFPKTKNNYKKLKGTGLINFISTSNLRGITIRNAIIIVDESENLNYHELKSILTRVGEGSKIILCGDYDQTDLIKSKNDVSGINKLKSIATYIDSLKIIEFTKEDIVRSGFVKEFLLAEIEYNDNLNNNNKI